MNLFACSSVPHSSSEGVILSVTLSDLPIAGNGVLARIVLLLESDPLGEDGEELSLLTPVCADGLGVGIAPLVLAPGVVVKSSSSTSSDSLSNTTRRLAPNAAGPLL